MKKNERIILLLLASVNFTHILDFMIMLPLGNYLMPYFDISTKQFSFLVSAYTFSAAASGFGAAFFVDQFDRKLEQMKQPETHTVSIHRNAWSQLTDDQKQQYKNFLIDRGILEAWKL
jgi:MFS family permease